MINVPFVALLQLSKISTVKNSYKIPSGWSHPKFWLGQSVVMVENPQNRGIVTGCEWMPAEMAALWDTDDGWWYTVTMSADSPCYRSEPQRMLQEERLTVPPRQVLPALRAVL